MEISKEKLLDLLTDLKQNYDVLGVKTEFEDEGAQVEEALLLKEIAQEADVDFTIKIGGCGSLRDIFDIKTIGVNSIVAPMIESQYALKKYIETVKLGFSENEIQNMNLYINIETITGCKNLEEILVSEQAQYLNGVVLGRLDLLKSMNLKDKTTDCNEIFKIASDVAQKTYKYNKELIIGGGVTVQSIEFLKNLPQDSIKMFETRKIIFDFKSIFKRDISDGIIKAIDFEIMWLKYKQTFCKSINKVDDKRLVELEKRYKSAISALKVTI